MCAWSTLSDHNDLGMMMPLLDLRFRARVTTVFQSVVQVFKEGNDPSICNEKLPNDSVYHRFLYVLQVSLAAQGCRSCYAHAHALRAACSCSLAAPYFHSPAVYLMRPARGHAHSVPMSLHAHI